MAQDRFSNEKYVDWVKVKLSLQYAKEGLEPVTEQRVQAFHNSLSSTLQAPSSSSATGTPTLCHGCLKEDLKKQWSRQRFSCLGGICDGWLESLQQNHVNPTSTVEWDNVDVSQLPVSRWECAKVYLPYGSGKVQGAGDADLAAIMTLYLNCRHFTSSLQDISLCEKVKDARNSILHSGSMEVDRTQMLSYVGLLKQLLNDPAFAADTACQAAVSKIDQLVRDKLELSLNKELELKVLNGDIKSVVVKTDQLRTDMADLTSQVQQQTGQLRTDVTTEVSNLRGQVGTVTTEVSNMRGQVGTVTTDMTNLRDRVGTATTEVSNLRDQVGTVATEVSNLRGQVGTVTTDMTNLRDRVGTATTEVSNVRDQVNTVATDMSNLRGQVGTVTTDMTNLRDRVGTATTEVSSLRGQVGTVATDMSNLRGQVGTVTTDMTNLRDQVGTAKTEVSNLRDQLGTHISGADKEMTNLKDRMEASMKDIVELQKIASLLCSFINACQIDKVDMGQLAASINTLSALKAETDRQGQVLALLQKTVGRHDVTLEQHGATLEQHGGTLEQHKRKLNIIESDLQAKKGRRDRQNPEVMDVTDLQHHLIDIYKKGCAWENPMPVETDDQVTISHMYLKPLMKIAKQKREEGQREQEPQRIPLSLKHIFYTDEELCKNIYVTGHAGMGKTTFCKKLVNTWINAVQNNPEEGDSAEDLDVLKEFTLLFYVNLREVQSTYHIEDMIRKNVSVGPEYNLSDILGTEKCLVVLDGLDEWSRPKGPQQKDTCRGLNENIPGRNTTTCAYLTTTRNWKFCNIKLKWSRDYDKQIELCGIDKDTSKEFAQKMVDHFNTSSKTVIDRPLSGFFEELKEKKLDSLTNVPVLLIYLITLWYFCKDLGKSQVQLYCKMLELLFEQAKKHLDGEVSTEYKPDATDTTLPECFNSEDNCQTYTQLLICLSKLAFMSLLNKEKEKSLIFTVSRLKKFEIGQTDIDLCFKCGIFTQDRYICDPTSNLKKYSFLHKKLQEFLAAVHFVTSNNVEDNMRQVRQYCDKLDVTLEMEQVIMFVCGMNTKVGKQLLEHLLSVVSEDTKVQHYRQSRGRDYLIQDIQTCVMACVTEGASNGLTYDVHLQDYYINDDTISDYITHVVEKKITSIKSLYINTEYCSAEQVTAVLKHLQTVKTLEKLEVGDLLHVVSDCSIVTSVLTSNVSTLQSLNLLYVGLYEEALFAAVLRCVQSLRALMLFEDYEGKKQWLEKNLEELEEEDRELEDVVKKKKLVLEALEEEDWENEGVVKKEKLMLKTELEKLEKLEEEDREKEDVVKKKKLVEELEKMKVESRVSHGRIEQLLPATSHLTHLDLVLECSDHGEQYRPVLDLSDHTQLETLNLGYLCVTNLHTVANSVEKVVLYHVTVAHSTLSQFIEALAQSSNKVQVELIYVTVTEDSDDPADLAAYIRDCDKFTVGRCDIDQDDKLWVWVKFQKK